MTSPAERAERVLAGEVRAASRLMRDLDDGRPEGEATLALLYAHTGRAHVVGVTGNPGAGKSTLTDRLVGAWRARGLRVGVVAIDPSSPFTGGAILGDRVRMQRHSGDSGVFIRSLATRGVMGGLSRSTRDVVNVFDAMGFERIVIETVGVGQDEVDVANTAHTSVVVMVPGLGDSVQALKAGLLEIADLFVVNKADRPDAARMVRELEMLLDLEGGLRDGRVVPILQTVATDGQGTDALVEAVEQHRADLLAGPGFQARLRRRRRGELADRVEFAVRRAASLRLAAFGGLEALVDALCEGRIDPATAARQVVGAVEAGRPD
ncbi:MAG: methylmalonyl Co-A mutase-associated GTPase MeaB [Bradymonadia bacterium]